MEETFRRALACHNAGQLEEAEQLYRQILNWRPAWTFGNLGMVLRITGRLAEAEEMQRRAISLDPANLRNIHALSLTLLQAGKFAEGWLKFETRRDLDPPPRPGLPLPPWEGEPLRGKRILVMGEQGLGDQILFSRFIPLLAEQASEVIFVASRTLVRLFEPLPARTMYPETWQGIDADVWIPLGSLPHFLGGVGPTDVALPKLFVPTSDRPAGGYGLMLGGGERNPNPSRLPPPHIARAIRGLTDFVALDPEVSGARDFADTAGVVASLAGVVSVDTSVAHLSGSMGTPCWVMAPRPALDWYMRWDDDRSPWYPTLRVVRQSRPGDWASVIRRVAETIA